MATYVNLCAFMKTKNFDYDFSQFILSYEPCYQVTKDYAAPAQNIGTYPKLSSDYCNILDSNVSWNLQSCLIDKQKFEK